MAAEEPILQYMPALATLVDAPPEGDDYLNEIKHDGYRMSLQLERGRVRWTSRHGKSWTHELPELVEAASSLDTASAVLDGELVVLTPSGLTSFEGLQTSLRARPGSRQLVYFAFDLLHLAGGDLTKTPLEKRKEHLRELVASLGPSHPIRYTDHIVGDGARFFKRAQALGVE